MGVWSGLPDMLTYKRLCLFLICHGVIALQHLQLISRFVGERRFNLPHFLRHHLPHELLVFRPSPRFFACPRLNQAFFVGDDTPLNPFKPLDKGYPVLRQQIIKRLLLCGFVKRAGRAYVYAQFQAHVFKRLRIERDNLFHAVFSNLYLSVRVLRVLDIRNQPY